MKRINFSKEELIKKIKEKKELSGIADKIVEEELDKIFLRTGLPERNLSFKEIKIIIKEVREELRKFSGRFQHSIKKRNALFSSGNYEKLLKTHSSTSERIRFYPKLKKIIKKTKIKSILDLGCGLNPMALADPDTEYFAADIKEDELEMIEKFFKQEKIKGNVFFYDIRKIRDNLPEADLCIVFKVLDVIGKTKREKISIAKKILENVKCRYFLISFSTKKLSGKAMKKPEREWFENLINETGFNFRKIKTENEVFYLIKTMWL